ncbi:MAG: hypothetical protein Q9183_006508, partial [Haloplaca sp. 2 TL-2023]
RPTFKERTRQTPQNLRLEPMASDRKDQTSQMRSNVEPGTRIRQQKKKVLLMGKSGAGKSSMRSIIFSNHVARDVRRLQATIDVDKKRVKFLGNLVLDIWDCGGQDAFTESYLTPAQRPYMFSDVGVLIYVFDIESSDFSAQDTPANTDRDLQIYGAVIKALAEFSPRARIFVMIHKMDVVKMEERESVLDSKSFEIVRRSGIFKRNVGIYGTSIWDETLYRAWGSIVNSLIPNLDVIEDGLKDLRIATEAEEIVLFEQNTFLTITRIGSQIGDHNPNRDRFEKISHVIKTFKHSLGSVHDYFAALVAGSNGDQDIHGI